MSLFNTKVKLPAYFYICERVNNKLYRDYYDCLETNLSPDIITQYTEVIIKKLESIILGSKFFLLSIKKYPFYTINFLEYFFYCVFKITYLLRKLLYISTTSNNIRGKIL